MEQYEKTEGTSKNKTASFDSKHLLDMWNTKAASVYFQYTKRTRYMNFPLISFFHEELWKSKMFEINASVSMPTNVVSALLLDFMLSRC